MGDHALRRIAIAFTVFNVAEWATWIAMLVYAYGQGGVVASGLVAVLQLVPAAIFAPFGAALADRYRRKRVLSIAYVAQAAAMGATALALGFGAPAWLVYLLAASAATMITLTRPAQNGLLPTLSTTAEALTKANSVLATIENASILVAPAFAGVLLALVGPGAVYAFMSVALALAALVVSAVMWPADGAVAPVSAGLDAGQALKVLAADRRALLLVGLLAGQALQVGALDVLFVALALGVLGIGETGVGALNSALGLGGVIGAVVAGALAARSSLPRGLAIGVLVWGGGLAIVSALPNAGVVLAFVAAAGAGRGLMDVSGRTLLQRVAPLDVLSRVFGVLEGFSMAALAAGAAIAPILVETIGIGAAVLAVGAALPLTLVLTIRPLLRLETLSRTSPRELRILRAIPIFASLPVPTLERLAHTLERIDAPAGTVIVREGDMGDRLFVIDEGVVSVSIEERRIRQLGPGEFFGEIALLRDVPRTASVTALEPVRLYSLRREEFLSAMRSRPNGAHAAEAISWSREP